MSRLLLFVDKIIKRHIEVQDLIEEKKFINSHIYTDSFTTKDGRKYKVRVTYKRVN